MEIIRKLSREKGDEVIHNFRSYKDFHGIYTYVNGYSYLVIRKRKEICNNFDGFFSDGIFLIFFYNLFFRKKIIRVTFDMTSLAPAVFDYCIKLNKKIFFVGGKEEEIVKFVQLLKVEYPGLDITGYQNGYMQDQAIIVRRIIKTAPDVVIAGLGCPNQEEFLSQLKREGWQGIGFTCGAFISQTQENMAYYPKYINALHLRWVYRLINERHTRRRFFNSYPIFPFIFIKDILQFLFSKKKNRA